MLDSLRVGFFTHAPSDIAYVFYRDSLQSSGYVDCLSRIEEGHGKQVLLVMQHSEDLRSLEAFRRNNPGVLTGVVDPRGAEVLASLPDIDFFIVDSLEKRDYFLGYGRPIFLYHDVLHLPHQSKEHRNGDRTVIGYHGNRVHLEAMFPAVTAALEALGQEIALEFWAIYDHERLGKWTWEPRQVRVRHIQWDAQTIAEHLGHIDIGIAPNALPLANAVRARQSMAIFPRYFNEKSEDYLVRFKVPTNPGRIYVFANASIPVVSDFSLSGMRWIEPGISGEIAHHTGAWYHALKTLARDASTRDRYATALWKKMERDFSPAHQNKALYEFLGASILGGEDRHTGPILPHAELDSASTSQLRWKFRRLFVRDLVRRLKRKLFGA